MLKQNVKLNPPTAAAISHASRRISYCEAIFHPPVRVDLVEKTADKTLRVLKDSFYKKVTEGQTVTARGSLV